jgi:hypothetical protein
MEDEVGTLVVRNTTIRRVGILPSFKPNDEPLVLGSGLEQLQSVHEALVPYNI